jgi:hypothetical protein
VIFVVYRTHSTLHAFPILSILSQFETDQMPGWRGWTLCGLGWGWGKFSPCCVRSLSKASLTFRRTSYNNKSLVASNFSGLTDQAGKETVFSLLSGLPADKVMVYHAVSFVHIPYLLVIPDCCWFQSIFLLVTEYSSINLCPFYLAMQWLSNLPLSLFEGCPGSVWVSFC